MLGVNACLPYSRGHVHAKWAAIDDKPAIVANFLTEPRDVKATVEGLRCCRELVSTTTFDRVRGEETLRACASSTRR